MSAAIGLRGADIGTACNHRGCQVCVTTGNDVYHLVLRGCRNGLQGQQHRERQ